MDYSVYPSYTVDFKVTYDFNFHVPFIKSIVPKREFTHEFTVVYEII
jgi:hypothetical protein